MNHHDKYHDQLENVRLAKKAKKKAKKLYGKKSHEYIEAWEDYHEALEALDFSMMYH